MIPSTFKSHHTILNEAKNLKFKVLHLNVNSIYDKMSEIDLILQTKIIDIFMINESRLDSNIPSLFYSSPDYKIIRLDREGKCGVGEIVFIRKDLIDEEG